MKKILLFIILTSFLFGQSLTKGWYNESFEVPDSLWAKSVTVTGGTPGTGKVLTSDPTGIGTWQTPGTGEVNTASNQGAGIGVFDNKNVLDLEFRSLVSQNNRLTIGLDAGNKEIDFTIVEANIDHDALANFLTTEHFIQSAIVETGALNAGSITSGFGAIDIGADTYTTTGLVKADTIKASGNVDIDGYLRLGADARYPMEGYATGRNVTRSLLFFITGTAVGTTCTFETSTVNTFNGETLAAETVTEGTPGARFSLDAAGNTLTITGLSQTVIKVLMGGLIIYNTTGTAYTVWAREAAGDIVVEFYTLTGTVAVFSDVADTKSIQVQISYVTST